MITKKSSCGLEICSPFEIRTSLKFAADLGFEFVSIPLVHPRFKREFLAKWKDRLGPFARPDMVLNSDEWCTLIAGRISPYFDIACEFLNGQARFALEQELNYGSHLDVPALIIPLRTSKYINLARIINSSFVEVKAFQIWLEIPLICHEREASIWRSDITEEDPVESTWKWWTHFHILCNFDRRLGILLEITNCNPDEEELRRWIGEPIKCLVISTTAFLTNKKGYPILSKPIKSFIRALVPANVQYIIRGNYRKDNLDLYRKYIDNLWQVATAENESKSKSVSPKENSAQINFESFKHYAPMIVKLFEENPIQYKKFAEAVCQAIVDRVEKARTEEVLNIMVVGAGKGVLIFSILQVAQKHAEKIKIYALETNKCNVLALENYKADFWRDNVDIISEGISSLNFPQIIDIVVFQSLDTFGDNGLTPEILDKAQTFLKKEGICIPERYSSYISPIHGTKAYSELKECKYDYDSEVPLGVVLKQVYIISPRKSLFSFHHPNYSEHYENTRYKHLSFEVEQDCTLHGFAGFFEATLYKDIKLSYMPESESPEFVDWNPLFFPLVNPVHLKKGDEIETHFWRLVSKTHVWYEWTITKPVPLPVHNPNGRSSRILKTY